MEELLPKVAVTPETVAGVIEDWRSSATVPPPAGGPDPAKRSEGGASPLGVDDRASTPLAIEDDGPPVPPEADHKDGRLSATGGGTGHQAREVWLEVGFGGGEHLAWQAERHPDTLMIGAEPFINGAAKLLSAVEDQALANVRIRHGDARDLMAAIPDGAISHAFVLHPDPWPKRKHWKRRIVSVPFLAEMHRICAPGAELRVASDIPDYVRWALVMRDRAEAAGARWDWTAERIADWTERPDDWPQTRYEAKAIREGRVPTYLRFERG